jgi:para-nitrobenzyl esterase
MQRRDLLIGGTSMLAAASLLRVKASAAGEPTALARTRSGPIAGYSRDGVNAFLGIPYGADTAPRRFQPALPEEKWQQVRDATRYAAAAPQIGEEGPGNEDCLYLNVWTPGLRDGARRPVLVYIHGGGFNNGSGSAPVYDGTRLCRRGDVVVITLNHRLNAFGYLYLAEFVGSTFADSGNAGQLDLVQALQWVREHAAEFGGDAGNVTLFGQSGGGAKIATLMAMPAARGLFHRAWTMSGQQVTAAGPRAATQRAQLLCAALGMGSDPVALAALPAPRILEALRTRDPSRVEDTGLYFGPVMDSRSLPRHPFWPDAPAQSAGIPLVIGNTRDETRALLGGDAANHALSWETLPEALRVQQYSDLSPDVVVAEYRRLYPQYSPSDVFFAATTAGRSWRGAVLEAEVRARQRRNTWAYQLDWPSPLEAGRLRALHALDIALVFDNIARPGSLTGDSPDAQRMADRMSESLLALARHGDPNHRGIPHWAPYSLGARATLVFDTDTRLVQDPRGGERRLYERVPFVQRGTF